MGTGDSRTRHGFCPQSDYVLLGETEERSKPYQKIIRNRNACFSYALLPNKPSPNSGTSPPLYLLSIMSFKNLGKAQRDRSAGLIRSAIFTGGWAGQ